MKSLFLRTQPEVGEKFSSYPADVRGRMNQLREIIIDEAQKLEGITHLEESLKWGEPSYRVKKGSPIRMDWKPRDPENYALYFNCSTQLVPTFRQVYSEIFSFEGKRAIIIPLAGRLPEPELRHCIRVALSYQRLRDLPLLGM